MAGLVGAELGPSIRTEVWLLTSNAELAPPRGYWLCFLRALHLI